jgi:hypothetical protein
MQGSILLDKRMRQTLPFMQQAQPSIRRDKRMSVLGFL